MPLAPPRPGYNETYRAVEQAAELLVIPEKLLRDRSEFLAKSLLKGDPWVFASVLSGFPGCLALDLPQCGPGIFDALVESGCPQPAQVLARHPRLLSTSASFVHTRTAWLVLRGLSRPQCLAVLTSSPEVLFTLSQSDLEARWEALHTALSAAAPEADCLAFISRSSALLSIEADTLRRRLQLVRDLFPVAWPAAAAHLATPSVELFARGTLAIRQLPDLASAPPAPLLAAEVPSAPLTLSAALGLTRSPLVNRVCKERGLVVDPYDPAYEVAVGKMDLDQQFAHDRAGKALREQLLEEYDTLLASYISSQDLKDKYGF